VLHLGLPLTTTSLPDQPQVALPELFL
jgi:hypothetical protein